MLSPAPSLTCSSDASLSGPAAATLMKDVNGRSAIKIELVTMVRAVGVKQTRSNVQSREHRAVC